MTETAVAALGNDFVNRFDVLNANEFLIEAAKKVAQSIGIKAELMQDRGMQTLDMEACFSIMLRGNRRRSQFIGFPNADASIDAAAGHQHREAVGVVVSASARSIF